MKLNKENLEKALEKIGWSLGDIGCNELCVINHKGEQTDWIVYGNKIELANKYSIVSCFFNECSLRILKRGNAVSIFKGINAVFILFRNPEL